MGSPFYTGEHEAFRDVMRRFVAREIEPYAHEWDEVGEFPRELYRKASETGLLGLDFPEEYGGVAADQFMKIVASQELARAGAGGFSASLMSHTIGSPPIARAARPEVKARVLPEVLPGEKISALAITEPSGGSDVALCGTRRGATATILSSTARRPSSPRACGPISNGGRAHRRAGAGRHLPAADRRRHAGLLAHATEEDGLVGSDTATLYFDESACPPKT